MFQLYSNAIFYIFLFVPAVMIPIGIARKRESNGVIFFFIGWFFLSCFSVVFLIDYVSGAICYMLRIVGISASFEDTNVLSSISIFVLLFVGYRLYKVILYWESRKFIGFAKEIIANGQSSDLPDCSDIVIEEFKNRILHTLPKPCPKNPELFTVKSIYNTALKMLSSGKYNWMYGPLTEEGEQLKQICTYCLEELVCRGIIAAEEKELFISDVSRASCSGTVIGSMIKEQ